MSVRQLSRSPREEYLEPLSQVFGGFLCNAGSFEYLEQWREQWRAPRRIPPNAYGNIFDWGTAEGLAAHALLSMEHARRCRLCLEAPPFPKKQEAKKVPNTLDTCTREMCGGVDPRFGPDGPGNPVPLFARYGYGDPGLPYGRSRHAQRGATPSSCWGAYVKCAQWPVEAGGWKTRSEAHMQQRQQQPATYVGWEEQRYDERCRYPAGCSGGVSQHIETDEQRLASSPRWGPQDRREGRA